MQQWIEFDVLHPTIALEIGSLEPRKGRIDFAAISMHLSYVVRGSGRVLFL
jgi:hypothetical protein